MCSTLTSGTLRNAEKLVAEAVVVIIFSVRVRARRSIHPKTMAPEFTVIHCPGLPTRSSRILWLLEELGLPYTVIPTKLAPHTVDSTLKMFKWKDDQDTSPILGIPALKDGDTWFTESGAITEYILARYGEGRLTPPVDTVEYGLYLQWLWFAEASLNVWSTEYALHKKIRPDPFKVPQVLPVMEAKAEKALTVLEKNLEGKEYVLGDLFTAADIFLGQALSVADIKAGLIGDNYPNIKAYLKRILERPAAQKAFA
eukprot:jgi/Botrbrau1/21171/Bobra.0061s0063.1